MYITSLPIFLKFCIVSRTLVKFLSLEKSTLKKKITKLNTVKVHFTILGYLLQLFSAFMSVECLC